MLLGSRLAWQRGPEEERRRLLADELRRIVGFTTAVVGETAPFGLDIPEGVPGCVATLASCRGSCEVGERTRRAAGG
jgi:hypothetical protein